MILKNILWDFFGRFFIRSTGFVVTLILTAILDPEAFGVIGLCTTIVFFANQFIDVGFSQSLVQAKKIDDEVLHTFFWIMSGLSFIAWILIFSLSPVFASFYEEPKLEVYLKWISVLFPLNLLTFIPNILLVRSLKFKLISVFNVITSIISGIIAIYLALNNYGVWSLIVQSIIQSFILSTLLITNTKYYPQFIFSLKSIKPLWNYGMYAFLDSIFVTIYSRIDTLLFGKIFTFETLGQYHRAKSMLNYTIEFSSNSLTRVLFPYFSQIQDHKERIHKLYLDSFSVIAFISIGLSGLIYLSAKDLFLLLFGPEWVRSADLLKILIINGYATPVSAIMINVILGLGYSKLNLHLGVIKKIIGLGCLLIAYFYSLEIYLYSLIATTVVGVSLNMYYLKKLISVDLISQWKKIATHAIVIGGVISITEYMIPPQTSWLFLILKCVSYSILYVTITFIIDRSLLQRIIFQIKRLKA